MTPEIRRLLDSATMRNARQLLAHLGKFRNQEHHDVLARLISDIEELALLALPAETPTTYAAFNMHDPAADRPPPEARDETDA
jgi:hypothetical protein